MTDFTSQEFIRDFLEESAEHLLNIRQNLLKLEGALADASTPAETSAPIENAVERVALVGELFRSFHTLKGLAGMVGLAPAEELSHAMESVLRAIQWMQIEFGPEVIDGLLQGTQTMEKIIDSLGRPGDTAAEIQPAMNVLAGLLPDGTLIRQKPVRPEEAPPLSPAPASKGTSPANGTADPAPVEIPIPEVAASLSPMEQHLLNIAQAEGRHLALALFTPGTEKAEVGVNVNTVRQQLSQAGEMVKAAPLVQRTLIRFAFIIVTSAPLDPADFPEMEWIHLPPRSRPLYLKTGNGQRSTASAPEPGAAEVWTGPTASRPANLTTQVNPSQGAAPTLVRVELERLDELVSQVSNLVVTRYRLAQILSSLQGIPAPVLEEMQQAMGKMERQMRDLSRSVLRTRMVPLSEVFSHMPLAVRELARASGKELRLVMEGENTEIDKALVERLLDPLLHLVRNAITHGIETPAERAAAGKDPRGRLELRGVPEGDHILISVCDDGAGIDTDRVITQAASLGLVGAGRAKAGSQAFSQDEILEIIGRPGFSTRSKADLGAGRGVGLDIVVRTVSSLGGSLNLVTAPGKGTIFTLRLPLTLTIVQALIVRCGSEQYAIPQSGVERVIEIDPSQIIRLYGGEIYAFQQDSLTLLHLADLFQLPGPLAGPFLYGLISSEGDRRTALVVDQIAGLREVVVRTTNDPLVARPGIAGATELGDGSVMLILDLPSLLRRG